MIYAHALSYFFLVIVLAFTPVFVFGEGLDFTGAAFLVLDSKTFLPAELEFLL